MLGVRDREVGVDDDDDLVGTSRSYKLDIPPLFSHDDHMRLFLYHFVFLCICVWSFLLRCFFGIHVVVFWRQPIPTLVKHSHSFFPPRLFFSSSFPSLGNLG